MGKTRKRDQEKSRKTARKRGKDKDGPVDRKGERNKGRTMNAKELAFVTIKNEANLSGKELKKMKQAMHHGSETSEQYLHIRYQGEKE